MAIKDKNRDIASAHIQIDFVNHLIYKLDNFN